MCKIVHFVKQYKKQMILFLLLTIVIFLITSVAIVDTIYTYLQFNSHFDYESIADPNDYNLTVKEHDIQAEDGIKIHIYEVMHNNPKGVAIMLTGITGPSVTYFYGEAQLVSEAGFASVLVDARGHGKSEGDKITFAIEDVKDVNATVEYIKSQEQYKDKPIVVMGLSMGGATAVNAGSLNNDIDGIIALSPYSSWTQVCIDNAVAQGYPRFICEMLRPGILLHGMINYGLDYFRIVPKETIKQAGDKPILIMRSTKDAVVSIKHHSILVNSYSGMKLESFLRDREEHHVVRDDNIAYPFDDKDYCRAILNFLYMFNPQEMIFV